MQTIKDSKEALNHVKVDVIVVGNYGSGKSHFVGTFPRVCVAYFAKGEENTILVNPKLSLNIVGFERFIPESPEDTKRIFGDIKLGKYDGELFKFLEQVKIMYKEGKCETLAIDTLTHLTDYLWLYINTFDKKFSKDGELDTRGMYGALHTYLIKIVDCFICSFGGNLVLACHEMLEDEQAMKDKIDKQSPVSPSIIGGFRDKVGGLVSSVLYLVKEPKQGGGYTYRARANKGNGRNAKSRFNLPEVIENISYPAIVEQIKRSIDGKT